jgi:mannosyltransferase
MLLVVGAVAVGVVLRFVTRSHLWLDEALSADIAALPLGDIPEALRHDGHPPLYYGLLHIWMQVVGRTDVAVRALSGLFALAALPLAYLAGRRAGGRLLGWLTLAVFGLSPFALRFATETRMYSLVSLLVLAGYLLLDDAVRRGRSGLGRLAALTVVVAALLWTHYWSLWLLGASAAVLLWGALRAGAPSERRGCRRALGALVVGGLLFLPWLPTMLYQAAHTGTPWADPQRPTAVLAITLTDFGGGVISATTPEPQLFGGVMLVLIFLAVFGVARGRRRIELDLATVPQFRIEAVVVALTLALAVAVMWATGSTFASRYASTILPLVLLLVAGGLSRFRDWRVLGGVLTFVLVLSSVGAVKNVVIDRTQMGQVADNVRSRAQPGDLVVYCPDQLGPAGSRVMPAGVEQMAFPHLPGDPWPVDRVDWVDYVARNAVDPRAYGRAIDAHGDPGRGIFVVYSGTYKTHAGTCDVLVDELMRHRGNPEVLGGTDGTSFFESASLLYFGGRPPG